MKFVIRWVLCLVTIPIVGCSRSDSTDSDAAHEEFPAPIGGHMNDPDTDDRPKGSTTKIPTPETTTPTETPTEQTNPQQCPEPASVADCFVTHPVCLSELPITQYYTQGVAECETPDPLKLCNKVSAVNCNEKTIDVWCCPAKS